MWSSTPSWRLTVAWRPPSTFVERLASACLEDARVRRIRVRAEKPEALAAAAGAGFELVLER